MAGRGSKELECINNMEDTVLQFGQEFPVHNTTSTNISFSAEIRAAKHKDKSKMDPGPRKGK